MTAFYKIFLLLGAIAWVGAAVDIVPIVYASSPFDGFITGFAFFVTSLITGIAAAVD